MNNNHGKISLRPLLHEEDGKRESKDTLNKEKDLSGRFCSKPFDYFEAQDLGDGKVFVCCPTWLNLVVGKLTTQSVSEAFNSKINQEIRKSILDGSYKYCNKKLCPVIQNDSLPKTSEITDPRLRKIIDNKQIRDLTPLTYNLCYDPSCNLACPSCRINKIYITEGPIHKRKMLIQHKIINEAFGEPHNREVFINVTGSGDPFGSKIDAYVFVALLCPLCAAASYLIVRKYGYQESIFSFIIYGKIFMIIFSGIFVIFSFKTMNFNDLVLNGISGIFRGTAMILVINAARHLPGAIFGSIIYVQIFAGVLLGYIVFGEIPTINNYVGNAIIIAAGLYIVMREMKLKKNIVSSTARHPTIPIKKD